MQCAERRLQFACRLKELPSGWSVRIQEVESLVTAEVVRSVGAPMQTLISQTLQFNVDCVRQVRVDQQIDVLGRPHNFMGSQSESANQCKVGADPIQGRNDFLDLLAQAGYCVSHEVIVTSSGILRRPSIADSSKPQIRY
jgi:hypothetical protein